MKARDIMTANPVTVAPGDSLSKTADLMRARGVGMLPVVDAPGSKHLCGVITDRDIAVRCVAPHHGDRCTVRDHMTSAPLAVAHPDEDVAVVMAKMEHRQVRRLPVVDEGELLIGIIAQADVALKVGAREPFRVEHLLESVSGPATHV